MPAMLANAHGSFSSLIALLDRRVCRLEAERLSHIHAQPADVRNATPAHPGADPSGEILTPHRFARTEISLSQNSDMM